MSESEATVKRTKRLTKAFSDDDKVKQVKGKKATTKTAKVVKDVVDVEDDADVSQQMNKLVIDQKADDLQYEKKTQREQILLRPGMYIGSTKNTVAQDPVFIFDDSNTPRIVYRKAEVNEGLNRLFIEVISNAIDNVIRSIEFKTTPPKFIRVNINKDHASVWNDGRNIPTGIHEKEQIHIPELIFGNLLTSSNYDDSKARKTTGMFGLGVKLVSCFSNSFVVDIYNKDEGVLYHQEWSKNMSEKTAPVIQKKGFPKTVEDGKNGFTKVTYYPDFSYFGKTCFSDDDINMLKKIVHDAAMTVSFHGVKVFLNDALIEMKDINSYVSYYFEHLNDNEGESDNDEEKDEESESVPNTPRAAGSKKKQGQFVSFVSGDSKVMIAPTFTGDFAHVAFTNGIYNKDGGVHVDTWCEAIFRPLVQKINNDNKSKLDIRDIRKHFFMFIFVSVDKPEFKGQMKEILSSPIPQTDVKPTQIAKLLKWDFVKKIEDGLKMKEMLTFEKESKRKKGQTKVDGLDDANFAGKGKKDCVLCITEGLSARTYVVAGMKYGFGPYKGRDTIGVLPIRGKFLNVKNASVAVLSKNKELIGITRALGLTYGTDYTVDENFAKLRYRKLLLAGDADSVAGHTPLLLRRNGNIEIKTIETLTDTYVERNSKMYGSTDYEVWTEKGWTSIVHVMKHKTTKRMYRIISHTGIVDVTEDHSLLNEDGHEIAPGDLAIGDTLLHSYPIFDDQKIDLSLVDKPFDQITSAAVHKLAQQLKIVNIPSYSTIDLYHEIKRIKTTYTFHANVVCDSTTYDGHKITPELAWVMGFFWADGTCGIYRYQLERKRHDRPRAYIFNRVNFNWSISNTNLEYLEKAKDIMQKTYKEFEWKIIEDRHNHKSSPETKKLAYRLQCNGGKITENMVNCWRSLFYDDFKNKKVPTEILNASFEVKEKFLEGYLYGDGNKESDGITLKTKGIKFDVFSQISAAGLFALCKSLGYFVSCNIRNNTPNTYSLNISKTFLQNDAKRVKKIIDLGVTELDVYDLETSNHHFQAGVGQMIVHNTDGTHIVGLIYNLFHTLYPSLLTRVGFFSFMRVPIIKIGTNKKQLPMNFYYYEQAKDYMDKHKPPSNQIRYFKGLGTSRDEDIKQDFGKRIVNVVKDEQADKMMENVFGGDETDFRKTWLTAYKPRTNFPNVKDNEIENLKASDFLNLELIKYSIEHCRRAIPSIIDGLKESTRKVLFGAFKKGMRYAGESLKVAQFGSYVAEKTNYHHGENNLYETITKLAQRFVGSNNIPLLYADGQFGSRLGDSERGGNIGKDAAAPRYIFTKLDMCTRNMFKEEDEDYLVTRIDDGDAVEPEVYVPIVPLILINGVIGGIGTGWSSTIPPHNLKHIVNWIKVWLKGEEPAPIIPYYRGFTGTVKVEGTKVITNGVMSQDAKGRYHITEIPIGKRMISITKYKQILDDLEEKGSIKSIDNQSTENLPRFSFLADKDFVPTIENMGLVDSTYMSNMVLFDAEGNLKKFSSTNEILNVWCAYRFNQYNVRKAGQLAKIEQESKLLYNKILFIEMVLNDKIVLKGKDEEKLIEELRANSFDAIPDFDYLLTIQIRNMTAKQVTDLKQKYASLLEGHKTLKSTPIGTIWCKEMDELVSVYDKWCKEP